MTNIVIAVDPGRRAGIAVLTVEAEPFLVWQGDVCCDGSVRDAEWEALNIVFGNDEINALGGLWEAALEDQFLGKNKRDGLRLAQLAGRWWATLDRCSGSNTKKILPRAWQSVLDQSLVRKKGTKIAAIEFVRVTYGVIVNEHVADAIGIGTYRALQLHKKGEK